jgi:hypothetical protein
MKIGEPEEHPPVQLVVVEEVGAGWDAAHSMRGPKATHSRPPARKRQRDGGRMTRSGVASNGFVGQPP